MLEQSAQVVQAVAVLVVDKKTIITLDNLVRLILAVAVVALEMLALTQAQAVQE
jgi:hypothetical protein